MKKLRDHLKNIAALYLIIITLRTLKNKVGLFRKLGLVLNFYSDYFTFKKLNRDPRFPLEIKNIYPQIFDKTANTPFDKHYIYHPAWAARVLAKTKPDLHVDISSSLSFSTILSAFIPVKFYDFRPAEIHLDNLASGKADLLSLPFESNSVKSLSCMHTIEHLGLGRYGDKIGPEDDLKAISELKRVLAPGGFLIFVVPIGRPKLMFNAHRIYSYDQIFGYFSDLQLTEFSLIPDDPKSGGIIYNADKKIADQQNYGCGLFLFKKTMA